MHHDEPSAQDGMDPMLLRLFQRQVADHCQYALKEAHDAQAALGGHNLDDFWRSAQSVIVAAGNISKALWGGGGEGKEEREARRAPLRASLGVEDASILKPTTFRNHLEHFDERLEDWAKKSKRRWFIDKGLGPKDGMIDPPPKSYEVFRNYNPATGELTFWGSTVLLPQLVAEVSALFPRAKAEAAKPHWEADSTSGRGQQHSSPGE